MGGRTRAARCTALAVALVVAAIAACARGADSATTPSSVTEDAFSVTIDPSVARVSPGGSVVSIATIRGARAPVTTTVIGVPNGVSVRVASATIAATEQTVKLIVFADAGAAVATYPVGVRVVASGGAVRETQLTVIITTTP